MLAAFRYWARDPLVAELRRRTHTPKNVRITLHQGAAPDLGDRYDGPRGVGENLWRRQKYPRRGRPVLVLYDSETGALKLILVGEMHPKELPDANSVVAMPTACASMIGTDLLARKGLPRSRCLRCAEIKRNCICWRSLASAHRFASARLQPDAGETRALCQEMAQVMNRPVTAVSDPLEVIRGADVTVCATNSNVPGLRR